MVTSKNKSYKGEKMSSMKRTRRARGEEGAKEETTRGGKGAGSGE